MPQKGGNSDETAIAARYLLICSATNITYGKRYYMGAMDYETGGDTEVYTIQRPRNWQKML